MGTHPIFESDFDCLTVVFSRMISRLRFFGYVPRRCYFAKDAPQFENQQKTIIIPIQTSSVNVEIQSITGTRDFYGKIEFSLDAPWLSEKLSAHIVEKLE